MSKFYVKEKVIGPGKFSNVWLVKSKTSNNYFVLKELNLSSMNSTETQLALTEITVLSRCRHRNIVKYTDAVIDHRKGLLSIIMEYAEGGDLYTAIVNQKGVPFKEHSVITWFTQICLALQYIHHKNILHRDLKTRNIFLTWEKQIKVGDFGIARCLMETGELATTTVGTPYYLSPEICQRKPYSFKSDIWSLGCVLFEMASLSHPFQACNYTHLVTLIITCQRKELPRHCCSLIEDLVNLLLNENAEQRPSADEILTIPSLQPYLSEVWMMQNDSTTSSICKKLDDEMCLRRHSSGSEMKTADKESIKKGASALSLKSRIPKYRHGLVNKIKCVPVQKLTTSFRTNCMKEPKFSSIRTSARTDPFSTYKVSDPISVKRMKFPINCFNSLQQKKLSLKAQHNSKHTRKNDEFDCVYENDEILKSITEIFSESPARALTKKHLAVQRFEINQPAYSKDVFNSKSASKKATLENSEEVNHNVSECSHSQCQQCMLDILWKNRIRGVIGSVKKTEERTQLIQRLQVVFGKKLFHNVYDTMVSNWETSENTHSPKHLTEITRSLNYSQLQNLPLMMQLIQLDLIPK